MPATAGTAPDGASSPRRPKQALPGEGKALARKRGLEAHSYMTSLQALSYQKRLSPWPALAIAACAGARGQRGSAPRPLRSQPCRGSSRRGVGRSGTRLLTLPSMPIRQHARPTPVIASPHSRCLS